MGIAQDIAAIKAKLSGAAPTVTAVENVINEAAPIVAAVVPGAAPIVAAVDAAEGVVNTVEAAATGTIAAPAPAAPTSGVSATESTILQRVQNLEAGFMQILPILESVAKEMGL